MEYITDTGKENGNYYLGFRVGGLGVRGFESEAGIHLAS